MVILFAVYMAVFIVNDRVRFLQRQGRDFFSSSSRPDQFWNPPILISNGYRGLFLWG